MLERVRRIGPGAPPDANGATLLGTAAWFGHAEAVEWLLDHGEPIDVRATSKETPLLAALQSIATNSLASCFEVARRLIERGASVHARDEYGNTPLHHAAGIDISERTPSMLLERGADVSARNDHGVAPVHCAAEGLNLPLLERLVRAGADVAAVDDDGRTTMLYALDATNGRTWTRQPDGSLVWDGIPIIHWLADRGVALDTVLPGDGRTTLMFACLHDRPELVELCLRAGVDVNARDNQGKTALFFARDACAKLLLDAGADAHLRDAAGATAWDGVVAGSRKDALLQAAGFPPRPSRYDGYPDARGRTRLMIAAKHEDLAAVQRFVATDDVNARDRYGRTALHYLLDQRYMDNKTLAVLRALLASAAIDPSAASKAGATPLHLLAKYSLPERELVQLLLARGADPSRVDQSGRTPADIMSARTHDPDVLALLTTGS